MRKIFRYTIVTIIDIIVFVPRIIIYYSYDLLIGLGEWERRWCRS